MKPLPNNLLKCIDPSERKRMGRVGRTDAETISRIEKIAEGDLHKHITNLLRQRGVRFIGHSRFGVKTTFTPDAPDFLFVWKGRAIGIEAKADNKAPSIDQLRCHADMREDGWLVFVVRSLAQAQELFMMTETQIERMTV